MTVTTQTPAYLEKLEPIITEVIAPAAVEIDQNGTFPQAAMQALGEAGLLGLISAVEVGGLGQGHRAATLVMERVAQACASTSMVLCMHYAAAAVIEAHGPRDIREAIAAGQHTSSLAFSEAGSRSHFWAPVSTASEISGNGHNLSPQGAAAEHFCTAISIVGADRDTIGECSACVHPYFPGLHLPYLFNQIVNSDRKKLAAEGA